MRSSVKYNEVRQKSSHNSYEREEGIYDQVLLWNIRSLEFDLHCKPQAGDNESHWQIYHSDAWRGHPNIRDLRALSRVLASIHQAADRHEVITVFLELVDSNPFEGPASPEVFDEELKSALPPGVIFSPSDFVKNSQHWKTKGLKAYVQQQGWPTLRSLRGRILFVLNHNGYNQYYDEQNPRGFDRLCFFAYDLSDRSGIGSRSSAIFYNIPWSHVGLGLDVKGAKFVSRLYPEWQFSSKQPFSISTRKQWLEARQNKVHHLATNKVDALFDPWSATDTAAGYPFESFDKPFKASEASEVPLWCLAVKSGTISSTNKHDNFAFYCKNYASGAVPDRDLQVLVSCPGYRANEAASCGLMARATEDDDAAYFAVLRPSEADPIRVQYRLSANENAVTFNSELSGSGIREQDAPFLRLVISEQGRRCQGFAAASLGDWIPVHEAVRFDQPLPLIGLAACSGETTQAQRFAVLDIKGGDFEQLEGPLLIGTVDKAATFNKGLWPPRRRIAAVPLPSDGEPRSGTGQTFNFAVSLPDTLLINWSLSRPASRIRPSSISLDLKRGLTRAPGETLVNSLGANERLAKRSLVGQGAVHLAFGDQPPEHNLRMDAEAITLSPPAAPTIYDPLHPDQVIGALVSAPIAPTSSPTSGKLILNRVPDNTQALAWIVDDGQLARDPGFTFQVLAYKEGLFSTPELLATIRGRGLTRWSSELLGMPFAIGRPEGARSDFVVLVLAITEPIPDIPGALQVTGHSEPMFPGQNSRLFNLEPEVKAVAYRWNVAHPELRFSVGMRTGPGRSSPVFQDLADGSWTDGGVYTNLFIMKPLEAPSEFEVTITPLPARLETP